MSIDHVEKSTESKPYGIHVSTIQIELAEYIYVAMIGSSTISNDTSHAGWNAIHHWKYTDTNRRHSLHVHGRPLP